MRTRFTNEMPTDHFFGYLPPHGILVPSHTSVVFDGDLHTILAISRGKSRKVDNQALDRDLHLGHCTVVAVHDQSSSSSTHGS